LSSSVPPRWRPVTSSRSPAAWFEPGTVCPQMSTVTSIRVVAHLLLHVDRRLAVLEQARGERVPRIVEPNALRMARALEGNGSSAPAGSTDAVCREHGGSCQKEYTFAGAVRVGCESC